MKMIAGLLLPLTPTLSPKGARENALRRGFKLHAVSAIISAPRRSWGRRCLAMARMPLLRTERLNLPFISAEKY